MEVSAPNGSRRTTVDNFFDGDTPHFIKIILEEELRNKILRIPRMFVERHLVALSDPVRVEIPTGRAWEVGLRRDDDGLYLQDGWAGFLEDCSVGLGYLLLFRHEGDSRFFVIVFDKTTCEIKYPDLHDVCTRTGSVITRRVFPPGLKKADKKAVKHKESDDKNSLGEHAKHGRKKPLLCSNGPSKRSRTRQQGIKVPTNVSDCSLQEAQPVTLANEADNGMKRGVKGKIVSTYVADCSIRETRPETSAKEMHFARGIVDDGMMNVVRGTDTVIDLSDGSLLETRLQNSANESRGVRRPAGIGTTDEFGGKVTAAEKSGAYLRASSFLCENTACVVRIRCLGCLHMSKKFLMACFPGRSEFGDIVCVSERKSWMLGINKSPCPRFRRGWTRFVADNNLRVGDACVFELMDRSNAKFRVVIFHDEHATFLCSSPPEQNPPCRETSTGELARRVNCSVKVECTDEVGEGHPFFPMVITKTSARHSVHVPATFAKSHLPSIQAGENVKASLKYKGLTWPVALYSRECCGSAYTMIKGWQKFRKGNGFQLGNELRFELVDKNERVFRVSLSNDSEGEDCCNC